MKAEKNLVITQTQRLSSAERILLLLILALGLGLRLWHIHWGLPELYEEAMPFHIQWKFWNWGQPGFNLDPGFFTYPGFTFYLQFLVQGIHFMIGQAIGVYPDLHAFQQAYLADQTTFVVLARLTTVCFDLGTIIVAYFFARRFANSRVALLTASLLALNLLHIKQSHLSNVDTPLTFFSMLSVYFVFRLFTKSETKWYVLAGLSTGLAVATKYNGGLLVVVLVFAHLLRSQSLSQGVRSLVDSRLLIGLLATVLVFIAFDPYIFLRFTDFLSQFGEVQLHMEKGHLGLDTNTSTLEFYLLQSLPMSLGWILTVVSLASVIHLVFSKSKKNLVLLAFPIMYVGVIGFWAMRADRYIIPIIPFLVFIGAMGMVKGWDSALEYFKKHRREKLVGSKFYKVGASTALLVILVLPPFFDVLAYHRSYSQPDTRAVVKEWIIKRVPLGGAIATGPFGINLSKYPFPILPIPFNAGLTEGTIPFYDTRWYEDLDLLITSDYDYGRYLQEPERFHDILQFYDTLHTRWTLSVEIKPSNNQTGPTFWLYKPPSSRPGEQFDSLLIQKLVAGSDSVRIVNFMGKLGLILSAKGKLRKSEQLFREVILIDPKNEKAHKELAIIYTGENRYLEALGEAEPYLREHPDDIEMTGKVGILYIQLGRIEEGVNAFKRVLSLDASNERAYQSLTIIYEAQNDNKNLIELLRQYQKILPADKSKLVEERIKKLKQSI